MCTLKTTPSLVIALFFGIAMSSATPADTLNDSSDSCMAGNVFYFDMATILFNGSFSLNYERTWGQIGIRFGAGVSYAFETGTGAGFIAMVNLFPLEDHSIEMGGGASVMDMARARPSGPQGINVYPAFTMCYRDQPSDGGFFFRVGFSYVFFQGTPFCVSVGTVF